MVVDPVFRKREKSEKFSLLCRKIKDSGKNENFQLFQDLTSISEFYDVKSIRKSAEERVSTNKTSTHQYLISEEDRLKILEKSKNAEAKLKKH